MAAGPGYATSVGVPSALAHRWRVIEILDGSMMVGGRVLTVGGMAYNDARTIYGAEAAGAAGSDFLMVRRAWARNNLVTTDEDVEAAVGRGVTNS
jgi:hypothetical protein